MWVRRAGDLGQAPGGQGRGAVHLRPLDDRRSVGPHRRQGIRRHRLGDRAAGSEGYCQSAARYAGAGTSETRLIAASFGRIAFEAALSPVAQEAMQQLVKRYGDCPLDEAEVVVALGGDGAMLETIHRVLDRKIPVYGMNRGSVGFLMNTFSVEDLPGRLERAQEAVLHPLRMTAVTETGKLH